MAIEWFQPHPNGGELDHIAAVLQANHPNEGRLTAEFEQRIAGICGRQYAVAVPNGTLAIAAALLACSAEAGDDVIVPDLTFVATANAARLVGCNVVLADVDTDTFCLTVDTVEAARTARTRFVLAVEVNGRSPNYQGLERYCRQRELVLITDSCESLGSDACGAHGWASALSFSPTKIVTTGQGGMVVTNSADVDRRLRRLKYQGMDYASTAGADVHRHFGINLKFTDIAAAIGLEQLSNFADRIDSARQRDVWYREALAGEPGIGFPPRRKGDVQLWSDIVVDNRDCLLATLREAGIGARPFWRPLHTQQPYLFDREFPNATKASQRGLWLPSSPFMSRDQVQHVAEAVKFELRRAA